MDSDSDDHYEFYNDIDNTDIDANNENIKSIVLSENQEECVSALCVNMQRYNIALNTSYMGRGKSIMTIECIRRMRPVHKIMICPSSMHGQWDLYDKEYDVGFDRILTYDSLRGTSNSHIKTRTVLLKHGLLSRKGDEFTVTSEFVQMLVEGVWIFCDECQKVKKKDRIQTKAVTALCKAVMHHARTYDSFCGVYMFSATPFYEEEHCINFCYTTGLISKELFPDSGLENSGLLELKEFCSEKIDRIKTNQIWIVSEFKQKKAEKIAFNLCVDVLLPAISKFSKEESDSEVNQTIFYTYEKISNIGMRILEASEEMIHGTSSRSVNITDEMERKYAEIILGDPKKRILSTRSRITQAQITAQVIKTYYIIVPLAQRILQEIPTSKVTIFIEYKEAIEVARRFLEDYGVIVLTGTSSLRSGERDKLIERFQEPNINYRVLISICQVGSVGLQFDDKYGGFPRFGLTPLIHSTEYLLQSAGRITRKDTKSSSLFFVCKVDTKGKEIEQSLKRTTEKKSKILQRTLKDNGVIPPANFCIVTGMRNKSFQEYLDKAGTFEYGEQKK